MLDVVSDPPARYRSLAENRRNNALLDSVLGKMKQQLLSGAFEAWLEAVVERRTWSLKERQAARLLARLMNRALAFAYEVWACEYCPVSTGISNPRFDVIKCISDTHFLT